MRLIQYFLSLLKKHRIRFIACILGLGVGFGAVFAISAYTNIMDQAINDVFFLEDQSCMILERGSSIIKLIPTESEIPESIIDDLKNQSGVVFAFPLIFKSAEQNATFAYYADYYVGIPPSYMQLYLKNMELSAGRWPRSDKNETVIGAMVENSDRTIGKTILMNNQTLSIVGILKPKNFVVDHFIVCDFSLIQKAFEMDSRCTMIYIFGEQDFMQNVDKLTQFKKNLEAKYSTIDVIDKSELELAAGNYFKFLDVINYVLEIFPLIVSLLFVYVLMVLNVKDQEREFGMLRAIGMPSSKLSIIIFSQSLFIGLMGYLTSFLFRMLDFIYFFYGFKANILNENLLWNFVNRMSNNIPIRVNWQILIASLVIGVVISVYPLYRATRQNIVVSFRKDE